MPTNLPARAIISFFLLIISLSTFSQSRDTISSVTGAARCGAGTSVLRAKSGFDGVAPVTYHWFEFLGGEYRSVGSLETGIYVTPTLIRSKDYYVSVEVGGVMSRREKVSVIINNTAGIYENPAVSLCDSVILNSYTTITDKQLETAAFQWQRYVVEENGDGYYIDLEDSASRVGLDLTVYEAGFYRVIISLDNGCEAISESVEVTPINILESVIKHDSIVCFTPNVLSDYTVIESKYAREITHFEWEESVDSVNFFSVGNDSSRIAVFNPIIGDDNFEERFYRLTVLEEGCKLVSEIVKIIWAKNPEGNITRLGSEDDFFYCPDDPENSRVIKFNTTDHPDSIDHNWYHFQYTLCDASLQSIEDSDIFEYGDNLGSADSILLGEGAWGTYVVLMVNPITGCTEFTNQIYVDSAIPDIIQNPFYPQGAEGSAELYAYDSEADEYQWLYSKTEFGTYSQVGTERSLTISFSEEVSEGYYRLRVVKNGCEAISNSYFVEENNTPYPFIELTGGGDEISVCPGEMVEMSSSVDDPSYSYSWHRIDTSRIYSTNTVFQTDESGEYYMIFRRELCEFKTNTIDVDLFDLPSTRFVELKSDSLYCQPTTIALEESREGDQYEWFYSDGGNFELLVSDTAALYADSVGSYYVEITTVDGCFLASDTIDISSVLQPALLEIGDSIMLCGSDPQYILQTLPSPGHQFTWLYKSDEASDFSQFAQGENRFSITVDEQGLYRVQIDEGGCAVSSETYVTINTDPLEPFDSEIVGDTIICGHDAILESSYSSDAAIYKWEYSLDQTNYTEFEADSSRLVLDSTFLASIRTEDSITFSVRLNLNDGRCRNLSLVHTIQLYNDLSLRIYNQDDLNDEEAIYCNQTAPTVTLQASTDWTTSQVAYQWEMLNTDSIFVEISGATSDTFEPNHDGIYRCVAQPAVDGVCADTSNVMSVAVSHHVEIYSDPTITLCGDAPSHILTANTVEDGDYHWFFRPSITDAFTSLVQGQELEQIEVVNEGEYMLKITSGACELPSDTITVEIDDTREAPEVAVEGSSYFCDSSESYLYSSYTSTTASYSWAIAINGGDYVDYSSLDSILFDQDFINEHLVRDSLVISVRLQVNDDGCDAVSEVHELVYYQSLNVSIEAPDGSSSDFYYCDDSELGFLLEATSNVSIAQYRWQKSNENGVFEDIPLAILSSYQPPGPGLYRCEISFEGSDCGAFSNEILVETAPKLIYTSSDDLQLCEGESIELLVDPGEQDESIISLFDIQWYRGDQNGYVALDGETTESLFLDLGDPNYGSGKFFYTATNEHCSTSSDTIAFYVEPMPQYSVNMVNATCLGIENGKLTIVPAMDSSIEIGFYTYILNDTLVGKSSKFESLSGGDYKIKIVTPLGCADSSRIEVGFGEVVEMIVDEFEPQRPGIPFQLSVSGIDSARWTPEGYFHESSDMNPTVLIPSNVESDTVYVDLYGYSDKGCMAYERLAIPMEYEEDFVFSTVVTPNGDGFNDVFEVLSIKDAQSVDLTILDNWGREIFYGKDYSNNSDQAYRLSSLLKEGVYFYIYKVDNQIFKGSFYCKS